MRGSAACVVWKNMCMCVHAFRGSNTSKNSRRRDRTMFSSGLGPAELSPPMMRCITSLAMAVKATSELVFNFADVSKNLI